MSARIGLKVRAAVEELDYNLKGRPDKDVWRELKEIKNCNRTTKRLEQDFSRAKEPFEIKREVSRRSAEAAQATHRLLQEIEQECQTWSEV